LPDSVAAVSVAATPEAAASDFAVSEFTVSDFTVSDFVVSALISAAATVSAFLFSVISAMVVVFVSAKATRSLIGHNINTMKKPADKINIRFLIDPFNLILPLPLKNLCLIIYSRANLYRINAIYYILAHLFVLFEYIYIQFIVFVYLLSRDKGVLSPGTPLTFSESCRFSCLFHSNIIW